MIAGTLEIRLFAELARLSKDMNDAKTVVGSAMKNIEGSVDMAKRALGALGIGLSIGYFVNMAKGSIDAADKLRDLSKATDIAVEDLAGLRMLAKQTGTDLDGLAKGINKMSVAMGKDPEAFKALGITAKDSLGAFKEMADLFNLLPDIQQRNALAMKVFGKSWADLAPAMSEGSKGIQAAIDKGKALSAMTKEFADESDKFNDKWAEITTSLDGARVRALGPMLPQINNVALAMGEAAREGGLFTSMWVGLGGAAVTAYQELQKLFGMHESQKNANRLKEIAKELEDARLRLQTGTTMPEGAGGFFSFLIPDIKLGEKNLEHIKELVKKLEAERAKLIFSQESSFNFDKEYEAQLRRQKAAGFTTQAEIDATAKAKNFLKEDKDQESVYRGMLKALQEKLLVGQQLTEVSKLQIALDALSAKQRATISPQEEEELKRLAKKVDLKNHEKKLSDMVAKSEDAIAAQRKEDAEAFAAARKIRDDALTAGYKQLEQMEFELTLIGMTNEQREVAIAMRGLETSEIDKQTVAYQNLRERMQKAILDRSAAEQAKSAQVSMWQSIEDAGHQAFLSIFDTSKSVLERIRDMLKTHLLDLLYQMTIKPWIIQLAGSMSGQGVAQSAFGGLGGGGGGGMGNLLSLGSSAYQAITGNSFMSSIGSALGFGGAGGGAALSGAALAAEAAALTGSGVATGMAAGAGAGMAAGAAAAIPYVGLAIAAYALLSSDDEPKFKDSDVGIYNDGTGKATFGQNNVLDSAWGEQFDAFFDAQYAKLSDDAKKKFIDPLIGNMITADGQDTAQNLSKPYQQALADAMAYDLQRPAMLESRQKELIEALQNLRKTIDDSLGIKGLEEYQRQLAVSQFRSPTERFDAARAQLYSTYESAKLGNIDSLNSFPQVLQQALGIGREIYASGPVFSGLFSDGNRMLNELLDQQRRLRDSITSSVPVAIKEASVDQVQALTRGFASIVTELKQVQQDLRKLEAA